MKTAKFVQLINYLHVNMVLYMD